LQRRGSLASHDSNFSFENFTGYIGPSFLISLAFLDPGNSNVIIILRVLFLKVVANLLAG
jgi:hypothetical protein